MTDEFSFPILTWRSSWRQNSNSLDSLDSNEETLSPSQVIREKFKFLQWRLDFLTRRTWLLMGMHFLLLALTSKQGMHFLLEFAVYSCVFPCLTVSLNPFNSWLQSSPLKELPKRTEINKFIFLVSLMNFISNIKGFLCSCLVSSKPGISVSSSRKSLKWWWWFRRHGNDPHGQAEVTFETKSLWLLVFVKLQEVKKRNQNSCSTLFKLNWVSLVDFAAQVVGSVFPCVRSLIPRS